MENPHANDVKMMDWSARLEAGKRQSSNNYPEGEFWGCTDSILITILILDRSYAEVLENTQYALIATVQKLYTMIRNGEPWELGEPEMNDRGQPVIHDIASKLGCIRASPDLPIAFPEGAEDFSELQAQLQAARAEMGAEDNGGRKFSEDSAYSSPSLERNERASSSESDSDHSSDYNQRLWLQQQEQQQQPQKRQRLAKAYPLAINTDYKQAPSKLAHRSTADDEPQYSARTSTDPTGSLPSPQCTEFAIESPIFRTASPFSAWGSTTADEFLGQSHPLEFTAHYMRQQQFQQIPRSSPLSSQAMGIVSDDFKLNQMNDGLNFNDGTIRPNMLDFNTAAYDMSEMDNIIFTGGDFEQHMGIV